MKAFDASIETYEVKYEKAATSLEKGRDALLAFYDFSEAVLSDEASKVFLIHHGVAFETNMKVRIELAGHASFDKSERAQD